MLNLALDATPEERERAEELEVGYDPKAREWELIVKYSGTLEAVRGITVSVTELMNGYAVVVIREDRIEELAGFPEIEFIEKPKSLYFEAETGRQVSCIDTVQFPPYSLSGKGTLVGIIDSGIDYANPAFRNEDGTTRIVSLWDQTLSGRPPEGYASGTEFTREEINEALSEPDEGERFRIVPSRDMSGHGTAVAGIAAGNGAGSAGRRYRGAAPEAELIVVKMGIPRTEGFPRTTELMTGVDYVIRKALDMRMPVAVNISFGNTYGSHDGTSLVERFLNDISDTWKNVICIGSGNEGAAAGHAAGRVSDEEEKVVELAVQELLQAAGQGQAQQESAQALLAQLHQMSRERAGVVRSYEQAGVSLPRTGVAVLDALFSYLGQKAAGEGITLRLCLPEDTPALLRVALPEQDAATLLADLVENAIIAVRASGGPGRVLVELVQAEGCPTIRVSDSGVPFPPEVAANWGVRRVTTHGDDGGSGIGLMSTYEICQRHRASFSVQALPPGGPYTKTLTVRFDGDRGFRLIGPEG